MVSVEVVRDLLVRHGQEHLLAFHDELPSQRRAALLDQIAGLDFKRLDPLIRSHVLGQPELPLPQDIGPAALLPAVPVGPAAQREYAQARARGQELIAGGAVAALVVAGGDGTRLGYDGPKGCLPITPVRRKPLFRLFAEQILAACRQGGARVAWYVMTSPSNDGAVRNFFQANSFFGLDRDDVFFFSQGLMPAFSLDGRMLLAAKDQICWNPDGHGGCLAALRSGGALDDMARRGVEHVSYFQVDNPLVRCLDPLFVGLHASAGADMSAKALGKRDPLERVGNFCTSGGRVYVIEYSDLPDEMARATRPDGTLVFGAGSIAIHVFSRQFIERLTAGGDSRLPFHRAVKKAPHLIPTGEVVHPDRPNAVKLEKFIFDALPMAEKVVLLETIRSEEFSPVKNATGADSPTSCLHDQVARAAGWLESAAVSIPRDAGGEAAAAIEISPLFALDAQAVAAKADPHMKIRPGESVYLE